MQVDVTLTGDHYELGAAVLLYQKKGSSYSPNADSNGPEAIATVHHISVVNGRPYIGAGRPMTESDYQSMVKVLKPSEQPQVMWQDTNVLAKGLGRLIWWTPPMMRAMFFQKSHFFGKKAFEGQAMCAVPGLVWMAEGNELYVYAFRGKERPQLGTSLCQAPLFNIWSNGKVCHGNAVAPQGEKKGNPKAWEEFLFGSHFTHPNFSEENRLLKGKDPHAFWKQMLKASPKVFPEKYLVDLSLKVSDLVEVDFKDRIHGLKAVGEF